MNDDETELTITSVNVFDPADVQVELYRITSFDAMEINSEQTVDLTVFGCVIWIGSLPGAPCRNRNPKFRVEKFRVQEACLLLNFSFTLT